MKNNTGLVYDVRNITTFRELIEGSAELYGERTAFIFTDGSEVREITYSRAFDEIKSFTAYLRSVLPEGVKVAVTGKNSYFWAISYLTVTCGVGAVVPIDKDLRADEVEGLLETADVSAVIYSHELSDKIAGLSERYLCLDMENYEEYIEKGRELREQGDTSYEDHGVNPHAPGILLFTSGTTGVSKGVMLSQYNICSNVMGVARVLKVTPDDRALSVAPLHHTFECTAGFLFMIYNGGSIAYNSSLRRLQADLKLFRPTVMAAVPLLLNTFRNTIIRKYSQMRGGRLVLSLQRALSDVSGEKAKRQIFSVVNETFGGRLRLIVCGAAPLDTETTRDYARFGIKVYVGYGLTETSPVITVQSDFYSAPGDVGRPIPGTKVRLDDVNEEGIGELVAKGPGVMLGYYENKEGTEAVMEDGWFHTGDLAKQLPSGAYKITGRIKSMIVTPGGKKVFPEELEMFLEKSPYISECMVCGKETDSAVRITALVFPDADAVAEKLAKSGIEPGTEEFREAQKKLISDAVKAVNAGFPNYKHISDIIIREKEFEKTTTRKIKRNAPENLNEG